MEWLGKELDQEFTVPPTWNHVHIDGKNYQHSFHVACSEGMMDVSFPCTCWAYLPDGQLVSMPTEETASELATLFPEAIYFFADTVSHPHA
jgi:hypothetical protein